MPLIAVYGSLRRGKCLHDHYMKGATFLGEDWIEGFEVWIGEWPYAVKGEGRIKVEVYEGCEETFEEINKVITSQQKLKQSLALQFYGSIPGEEGEN